MAARIKYFAECRGKAIELKNLQHVSGSPVKASSWSGDCSECGGQHVADRRIEMVRNPSRHVCDNRCVHATGRIMRCECQCGGKNHGRGTMAGGALA